VETQSEQEKMDQLMAERQGEAAAGDDALPASEPDTGNPTEPDAELSEQEKMDQLMAELQGQVTQEEATAQGGKPDEKEATGEGEELSEQEKMDKLMADLQGEAGQEPDGDPPVEAGPPETEPEEGLSDQEKMDRLMAELQGGGTPSAADSDAAEADQPEEELSEQEKMDRLMTELQDGGNGGQPEPSDAAESSETESPDEDLSEQDKMDRLMAELQGNAIDQDSEDDQPQEDRNNKGDSSEPGDTSEDDFQSLDDEETDLDGYDEDADTFEALDDDEENLAGYDGEEDAVADDATAEEPEEPAEGAIDPEPELPRKPVPRERKSLFNLAEERVSALPESSRRGPWSRILLISAGITILLAALFAGYTVYKNRAGLKAVKPAEQPEEESLQEPVAPGQPARIKTQSAQEAMDTRPVPTDDPADAIIQDRFATIDALRQSLQIKQTEIVNLKQDYESGIEQSLEVTAGLAAENQITDYKDALAVRRIAFELQTMQRRKAYIQKLEVPYNRLLSGSEALLYIKRLTEIDLAVAPYVGGLGTGRLLKRIDAEIDRHQLTSDKLQVAAGDGGIPGLESLWQAALQKSKRHPNGKKAAGRDPDDSSPPVEEVKLSNGDIWEQICNGQPDNKYRLTELTTEAAACLAKWKGKELFLNRLTTLTSRQARALAEWDGEWIGLNGLTEMDRATARAIFKWRGKRLSLNGFTEFPPGLARYLAKWKGKQLELMGLELLSHKTAVYFMEWKKAGGQLYIPNKFYRRK